MKIEDYEHLYKTAEYNNGKIVLRNLSDLTEEEYDEQDKLKLPVSEYGEYQFSAEIFRYLLSKHFDLFGLHEAGLCLYRNEKGELY